ncbi:MAG: hypothetical protein HYV15_01605 [Elusimicrobia bacterium]|nr:hypothetical protein [Elusimicrobiota bacterium]
MMIRIVGLAVMLVSGSALAAPKPEQAESAPAEAHAELRPAKPAVKVPLRVLLAEDYDPNKVCTCKKWRIQEEYVCVETDANGKCTKKELREVGRECVDWACHAKA